MAQNIIDIIKRAYPSGHALEEHFGKKYSEIASPVRAGKKEVNSCFNNDLKQDEVTSLYRVAMLSKTARHELCSWLNSHPATA